MLQSSIEGAPGHRAAPGDPQVLRREPDVSGPTGASSEDPGQRLHIYIYMYMYTYMYLYIYIYIYI